MSSGTAENGRWLVWFALGTCESEHAAMWQVSRWEEPVDGRGELGQRVGSTGGARASAAGGGGERERRAAPAGGGDGWVQ